MGQVIAILRRGQRDELLRLTRPGHVSLEENLVRPVTFRYGGAAGW
jgi:hypothetical protein